MRQVFRFLAIVAAGFFFIQCGKGGGSTKPITGLLYGTKVELQPVDLPEPPAGMIYQAWTFQLQKSGINYSIKYHPFRKMDWVGYPYHFTDPATGQDIGYIFKASPDTTNLFTTNLTQYVRADTIFQIVQNLLRGQSVILTGQSQNLEKMVGILLSLEPANETGPDTATPHSPFLAAYSNDSGKFEMVYPYNYRLPDFICNYFLATPTDTLYFLKCACNVTDSNQIRNEGRGVWFGFLDTLHYDLGRRMAKPDTVLRKLGRELLPGWQFEGWIERNGTRVSLGRFSRGDTSDESNPYSFIADSVFFVPGNDFVFNPPAEFDTFPNPRKGNVLGSTLRITLEPKPDNDPAMFPMILFQDTVPPTFSIRDTIEGGFKSILHTNRLLQNRARFFPQIRVRVIPESRSQAGI